MNRRRRFGSTILLSSLAALAVVGTGLAVGGTLLAEGSQDFNVTFTDNTKPEMGTVVVSEELKSTTLDVVFDDAGGTVAFSNDIVFEYTPTEGTNLDGKVLSLDYTATFTPDAFLTYFDVANDEGTLAVDPVATTADGVYTFTLKKDALGITLKAEQTYKAAKEALEGQAKVNLAFQVTADDEEVPPEPVEPVVTEVKLDADALTLTAGGEAKTLTATVTVDQGEAPIVNWTIPENDSITVTGEDTNTLTITPVKAGTVDITATAGEKSAKATITVEEAVAPEPEYVEKGKLGLFQVTRGEALYFTGEMDGFYFGTTTDFSAAVDVYAYDAGEGKLNLRIGEDGQYIAAKKSDDGEHENIVMQADPFAWGYDEAHDAYVATLSDGDYYIGNYSSYDTLSLSSTKYIDTAGNNIAHIVQEEIPGPALESIEISGPQQVVIGKTVTLKANPNTGAELGEVVWTSENEDVATVDEAGVVTGVAEGTVNIVATSGEISAKHEISVIAEEPDTITYNFAPAAGTSSSPLNDSQLLEIFQAAGESELVTNITDSQNVYEGYKDYDQLGLKFGGSSKSGTFTATLSQEVKAIQVTAVGWKTSDKLEVASGDVSVTTNGELSAPYDSAEPSLVTFTFEQAVTEFTLTFTNRGFIQQMAFVL